MPEAEKADDQEVRLGGRVRWADTGDGAHELVVELFGVGSERPIAKASTNANGQFGLRGPGGALRSGLYFRVVNRRGLELATTQSLPLSLGAGHVDVGLAADPVGRDNRGKARPTIRLGHIPVNAEAFHQVSADVVEDFGRAFLNPARLPKASIARLTDLSPDMVPAAHMRRTLCGTDLLLAMNELIRMRGWPREVGLHLEGMLNGWGGAYTQTTWDCPDFTIHYYVDGPEAPNPDTSAMNVIDPGLGTVLGALPAGPPPTYVKLACFWLERALNKYISPPFNLRNPAGAGRIQVYINSAPYGSATPGAFYLNNALSPDLLAAVTVHELFHMVQFQYSGATGAGAWAWSMREGGAVWAEDANTEMMNRYLDEAGTNFNGTGVQVMPQLSVEGAGYKSSLFFRYVSEQQSGLVTAIDEPLPIGLTDFGGDVYKALIEACEAGTFSADDIKTAIRSLPWYQDFYEFGYLDPARQDLTSSETTFGDYVLACYLKDLDENVPDRRFDFMEGQETIYMDEVIPETPQPGDKLAPVTLAGTATLSPGGSSVFTGMLTRFASNYFQVAVAAGVTNVRVQYSAPALTSGLFQIVLIDQNNMVREIYRTDANTYDKTFANSRAGVLLNKVILVATCAASSGSFTINVAAVAAATDVMVTRWNTALGNEYEIDSRLWSWTWVSPDIWVDNDGDGIADGIVHFNQNNKLYIRLHNKGNLDASGIGVAFYYQDASGGLSPLAWLPVQDISAVTQTLTGLALAAGASNEWTVNWSPVPSGSSHHFCIRAIVSVAGDPNTDNKRVLSNFGNVQVAYGGFVDLEILGQAGLIAEQVGLTVVPRNMKAFQVSRRDLMAEAWTRIEPGQRRVGALRIVHRPLTSAALKHRERDEPIPATRLETTPDPAGDYRTDPRSLPAGVAGRPMITIVQSNRGVALGGITFMIETAERKKPRSRVAGVSKTKRTAKR